MVTLLLRTLASQSRVHYQVCAVSFIFVFVLFCSAIHIHCTASANTRIDDNVVYQFICGVFSHIVYVLILILSATVVR